jgi:hypothetical protein
VKLRTAANLSSPWPTSSAFQKPTAMWAFFWLVFILAFSLHITDNLFV